MAIAPSYSMPIEATELEAAIADMVGTAPPHNISIEASELEAAIAAAIKASIEAYIEAAIAPKLPKYSGSYAYKFQKPSETEEHKIVTEIIILLSIREITKTAPLFSSLKLALAAKLCEMFKCGNCEEQAHFAAAKLVDHPAIANIYVIYDLDNDHVYLILQPKSPAGHYWIYDPWLYPYKIMEDAEYTAATVPRCFAKPLCRDIYQRVSADTLHKGDLPLSFDKLSASLDARVRGATLQLGIRLEPVKSSTGELLDFDEGQKRRIAPHKDGGYVLQCEESKRPLVEAAIGERLSLAFGVHRKIGSDLTATAAAAPAATFSG